MQPAPNFLPNEHTFDTPNALFLHTGALIENNDYLNEEEKRDVLHAGTKEKPEAKNNEFIIFDEA
jgi:hypothetical protein